jgi:superfamily II DNA/RNA helicase
MAASEPTAPARRTLGDLVPAGGSNDPDTILDLFLQWAASAGFELYPAQEEALLEIMSGRHVILSTPTGSGKSLVALGLHFKALCEGSSSFYTSPIKALASEKFFGLCDELGADRVGMLTGDASINPDAPVVCCTAEVLANLALRRGEDLDACYAVMDEFHYYSDPDRGWAWQVPLISLPQTRFLLMSATLGDMSGIARHLEQRTGREAAEVTSAERPVPLEFDYLESPLHETVMELIEVGRAPIYVVNFTQRDCAELAQKLTSLPLTTKDEKAAITAALGDARFHTPYGREFRRFLSFGIGVHHAGLLPKYRLTVEQLAQQGLLKIISGTDTLGVGVNIPIRTVLFTKLAKYDGRKVTHLKVRDFQQIAGRAGRKGFDDRGWVVAQAPEHVIERRREEAKAATGGGNKKRRKSLQKAADGEVSWTDETFRRLRDSSPERLQSRFRLTSGMVVDLLQRDAAENDPEHRNFHAIRQLVAESHEDEASKRRHLTRAAQLVRSLHREGIVRLVQDSASSYYWVVVDDELQVDFSLFHNLSLFLVDAIGRLDADAELHALDVLSIVESVLEDPAIIIRRQVDRAKDLLVSRLKAEGVPYEERMRRLDEVTHPQPAAEFIHIAFDYFRERHPWVGGDLVRPKSIAREMVEEYLGFGEYVRRYGLQRVEGVLLRYLSQAYKTLDQNVPDSAKTDAVWDVVGYLRAILERTDTSLIEEWESLIHPELRFQGESSRAGHRRLVAQELISDPRRLTSRVRGELHTLVAALSRREWDEAADAVRQRDRDEQNLWPGERFAAAMEPFFDRFGTLVFDHRSRLADKTTVNRTGDLTWTAVQVLCDPEGEDLWCIETLVDLSDVEQLEGPIIAVTRIGT